MIFNAVICALSVMTCVGHKNNCVNILAKTQAKGSIVFGNNDNYLVDFSQEAKKSWIGDYSQVLIKKSDCVELQKFTHY